MHGDDDVVSGFSRTDGLIDRAARELTEGEPSPRLRDGVRRRIEQPRGWRVPMWVPAAMAAALLIVVGYTVTEQVRDPRLPMAPVVATATLTMPAPIEPPMAARASRPARPVSAKIEIDPLVIEPLRVQAIAASQSSGVMPIEIDDLRIEPLQIE